MGITTVHAQAVSRTLTPVDSTTSNDHSWEEKISTTKPEPRHEET